MGAMPLHCLKGNLAGPGEVIGRPAASSLPCSRVVLEVVLEEVDSSHVEVAVVGRVDAAAYVDILMRVMLLSETDLAGGLEPWRAMGCAA